MSYYGVSVIITVLTSLTAFYLLYKARELNLGILISVVTGSVILGFSITPAFKGILGWVSDSINLSEKLALVISLLIILFIFLVFILVLSIIISIAIPKKFSAIDCCVFIDRFFESVKGKLSGNRDETAETAEKTAPGMKEIVKNVYYIKNKLKKPVDTNQIIDTMGIEKSVKSVSQQENVKEDDIPEAFSGLMAFMEPGREEALLPETEEAISAAVGETSAIGSTEAGEPVALEETAGSAEDAAVEMAGVNQPEYDASAEPVFEETSEPEKPKEYVLAAPVESAVTEAQEEAAEYTPPAPIEEETPEDTSSVPAVQAGEGDYTMAAPVEPAEPEEYTLSIPVEAAEAEVYAAASAVETENVAEVEAEDADTLIRKAFECKGSGRKAEAIEYYDRALQHNPHGEMVFWIVLDMCALYKQLGLNDLARSILEGVVSQYGNLIQPEIKMEIMNNLK